MFLCPGQFNNQLPYLGADFQWEMCHADLVVGLPCCVAMAFHPLLEEHAPFVRIPGVELRKGRINGLWFVVVRHDTAGAGAENVRRVLRFADTKVES